MKILLAEKRHADYISTELANFFSKANTLFEYPRYKDGKDHMLKHVTNGIESPTNEFLYYIQEDENQNPLGFINLSVNEYNIGSILMVLGENEEVLRNLIEYSIPFFKKLNVKKIQIEAEPFQTDLLSVLEKYNKEELITRFKISI